MKRWIVLALPLAIALFALGSPLQSLAQNTTDNNSNAADSSSAAFQDNLNGNDVAVDQSVIVEDNLNGPIGNDTQFAKQAANDNSIVVDDIKVEDVGNTKTTEIKGNDTQFAKQAANDHSIVVDDVTDVGNDKSTNIIGNDTQFAKQAANDHSFVVGDIENVGNTDNSVNIKDISVKVAASVLSGEVSYNAISLATIPLDGAMNDVENGAYPNKLKISTGDNCFAYGSGFTSNGIFANSQNTGIMSQTQQSISVQANLINQ
jgi:hypothetical protein